MGGDVAKRRFPRAAIIPINSAAAPASPVRSGRENRRKFANKLQYILLRNRIVSRARWSGQVLWSQAQSKDTSNIDFEVGYKQHKIFFLNEQAHVPGRPALERFLHCFGAEALAAEESGSMLAVSHFTPTLEHFCTASARHEGNLRLGAAHYAGTLCALPVLLCALGQVLAHGNMPISTLLGVVVTFVTFVTSLKLAKVRHFDGNL
ncbi:hypothetical protein B0H19DRAFT_1083053 [Mycena capillaripes]|nr:hypothetical protein B0H19DRAFT_1083053 [Mycena capillaripes]